MKINSSCGLNTQSQRRPTGTPRTKVHRHLTFNKKEIGKGDRSGPDPSSRAGGVGRARMLRFLLAIFVTRKGVCRMAPETQQSESPYCVRIETETGQSSTVPIAVLTPKQLEVFLQSEFKRLAQEAGVKGARIHVERAIAADYEQVLREVASCLFSAKARAA
jgi:hypothetical protein